MPLRRRHPPRPHRFWIGCVLSLLVLPLLSQAGDRLRNSFDLFVHVAPSPMVTEGKARLFHELHLRNFSEETLALDSIAVIDATQGREIERFAGSELRQRLARVPPATGADRSAGSIAPGASAVFYVELALPPGRVPQSVAHAVAYRVEGADGTDATIESVTGGAVAIDAAPRPALGPPLRGGPWAAVFHPAWERGHRRVFYTVDGGARIPGRFAMDLVKIGADGRLAQGDPDLVRNSHAYGNDVLAVADATVVAVRNDYPEVDRISENGRHPMRDGSGNYVVLDIGNGRHAFYEHLRPGSVRVRPGQRVEAGAVIAQIGFSGTGNWPHLHFHVADAPSLLGAEGLPFEFSTFRKLGTYPDISVLGQGAWTPDAEAVMRRQERPADNAVLSFDDATQWK